MRSVKMVKCPLCGAGSLKKKVGTESFEYKGETKRIPNYVTYACNECGEAIVDSTTLKESGKILKDFKLKMKVAFHDEIFRYSAVIFRFRRLLRSFGIIRHSSGAPE